MHLLPPVLGLLFLFSEAFLAWTRRSQRRPEDRRHDRGSLGLLWRVIGAATTTAVALSLLRIGPRLPMGVPWAIVGASLWAAGAGVRWWAIRHLGRFFTVDVAVTADQTIADDGPYRLIRHPSYTGLLLETAGLGVALGNVLGVIFLTLPIFLVVRRRIRVEEDVLRSELGAAYIAYAARTRMLAPWLY